MFSASLLSMMIHSVPPLVDDEPFGPWSEGPGERGFHYSVEGGRSIDVDDLADWFQWILRHQTKQWPFIPVVAQGDWEQLRDLQSLVMESEGYGEGVGGFIWGRFRLDHLMQHFVSGGSKARIEREYLDLGTPVRASSGATGSFCATSGCWNLLGQTPDPAQATIGAAVVDLGVTPPASAAWPEDFGGKLRHVAYSAPVSLSSHAESVLEVLLDRLASTPSPLGGSPMLNVTTVSMALVLNPTLNQVRVGKGCFKQHCAPEMLTALHKMASLLDGDKLPAVVNLSLGTHVGPHNGESPLERCVTRTVFRPGDRFLFAAAGNEGGMGISSRLELERGDADYMTLIVDAACTELLVEFWWDDVGAAGVEIGAVIEGGGVSPSRVAIRPGVNGIRATLVPASMGQRLPVAFLTLLESRARGNMSCIAFAMTRPAPGPAFEISFDLTAPSADAVVHAWIVISDPAMKTHFTQGGPDGTVAVPASDPSIVSVAGYDRALGQMWRHSSRGPSSEYSTGSPTQSPRMAHLVEQIGSGAAAAGTSFASPRAAADAARSLADPAVRPNCTEGDKLLEETYGPKAISAWNKRYGLTCRDS